MRMPIRRSPGFSLLETLVVLAIIMVLFTLLVPVLTRALRMAKRTAASEEMHSEKVGEMAAAVHEGPRSTGWTHIPNYRHIAVSLATTFGGLFPRTWHPAVTGSASRTQTPPEAIQGISL